MARQAKASSSRKRKTPKGLIMGAGLFIPALKCQSAEN
jgi:hypothetical protein